MRRSHATKEISIHPISLAEVLVLLAQLSILEMVVITNEEPPGSGRSPLSAKLVAYGKSPLSVGSNTSRRGRARRGQVRSLLLSRIRRFGLVRCSRVMGVGGAKVPEFARCACWSLPRPPTLPSWSVSEVDAHPQSKDNIIIIRTGCTLSLRFCASGKSEKNLNWLICA